MTASHSNVPFEDGYVAFSQASVFGWFASEQQAQTYVGILGMGRVAPVALLEPEYAVAWARRYYEAFKPIEQYILEFYGKQ